MNSKIIKGLIITAVLALVIFLFSFVKAFVTPSNINLCFLTDSNFVKPMLVSMYSIFENNTSNSDFNIYIINDNLSENEKLQIEKFVKSYNHEVHFIDADEAYENEIASTPVVLHITKIVFSRISIADLLPKNLDKVLVLDSDILVLSDLAPLYRTCLFNKLVAMAPDQLNEILYLPSFVYTNMDNRVWRNAVITQNNIKTYYNAGVMLIDLKKFRRNNVTKELKSCFARYKLACGINLKNILLYNEQDIYNIVLKGKIKTLNRKWNVLKYINAQYYGSSFYGTPDPKNVKIYHFIGPVKPWYENRQAYGPTELYLEYQKAFEDYMKNIGI